MKKIVLCAISAFALFSCTETPKEKVQPVTETPTTETAKTETTKEDLSKFGIADNSSPQGLQKGETIPDVTFTLEDGSTTSLKSLYKQQPLVVFFYRGYWCPYCNQYLAQLAEKAKDLEITGAKLIAITPETYENAAKIKDNTHANFTIISDKDGSIMKAFKVAFDVTKDYQDKLEKHNISFDSANASGEAVLPIPATYVIAQNGEITYSFNNPDYTMRAPIEEIFQNIPAKN